MKMKWDKLSKEENLSEEFIREHVHQLDWDIVCRHENISESFLEEMFPSLPSVPWFTISYDRNMSETFLFKYLPCLSVGGLMKNYFLRKNISLLHKAITEYETHWNTIYTFILVEPNAPSSDLEIDVDFKLQFHTVFHPFLEEYNLSMTLKANIHHDTQWVKLQAVSTTRKSDGSYIAFPFRSFPFINDLHFSPLHFVKKELLKHKIIKPDYLFCY